ncbi:NAD-dependent epimerase/dehydratase family protein [Candidatus Woesearchaeota archaeon]|nr:NAD-dependent epimerase/dehydratase family protein [Candidatus Woesearchaeota archaeon]
MGTASGVANSAGEKLSCRVCAGKSLQKVLSLGSTPPANAFLKSPKDAEQFFPLELSFCNGCGFVQLANVVSPELLFRDYVYVSSTSPVFVQHFKDLSSLIIKRFSLQHGSLVVDVGSNDGILLRPFKEAGMKVLGIDPAEKIAAMATASGIETLPIFFNATAAKGLAKERGRAKVITATSVFSHVDDLDSFVSGVKELLSDDGVFVIEVYYLYELLAKNLFDTIYHEHLSYFTAKTMARLLQRLGMEMFDVGETDTHGGSLRVFAQKANGPHKVEPSVGRFTAMEDAMRLSDAKTYVEFAKKIGQNKARLKELLDGLKLMGKGIVGYGAPAKGNTLLNYFGIGPDILDYIVDDSPWKQGLYTPGTHIPVVGFGELGKRRPDYILILAWNFAEPIMKKCGGFTNFIIPVPVPQVVNSTVEEDLGSIAESIKEDAKLLEGKTVMITGGSGFIGSYIVAVIDLLNKKFLAKPCRVISLDIHITGQDSRNSLIKEIASEHISFIRHDVTFPIKIDEPVDYIISAAGVASPIYYKKFPIETIEGTIFGVKNCLELARQKNVKAVLYFSSSEIYGDPDPNFIPTPEAYKGNVSSIGERSCYDESKRIGETMCVAYFSVHKVPVKIVRPFNVYGPGMKSTDYRVIPMFLSQGLAGRELPVHDKGNQTRTFCYITDSITAFFKVLLLGRPGEVYNVGNSSEEINMLALAETINSEVFNGKAGVKLIAYPDTYPKDEPRRRCPDLSKIRKELGYEAKVSLKEGLKRAFAWLRDSSG